ncbi:MAG TPA: hypothetical protein VJ570_09205 [Holophagaceae bacterium]|nr:hypothetical protein [Holophagaceae bacterium]
MFWFILIAGVVLYFVLKGKSDRPEIAGAPKRAMGSGSLEPHTFVCPYSKCGSCGAAPDKMKQEWDGLRTVKWTCGYCGNAAGVQELRDEELPAGARRRLGLDQPPMQPGFQQGPGYGRPGGGVGDVLTGIMIGSMLGGNSHHHDRPADGDWGSGSGSDSGGGWGDSGNESWGDSGDSGGSSDFGDSGGGDGGSSDW